MKKLSLVLMLVLFGIGFSFSQRTVTGTITDNEGEALIGANVLVKGTDVGTVTDIDGKYSLKVPEGSNVLVFSYTGYSTRELELGASNVLDVLLSAGVTLSDVVVTALGISREKKTLGYAIQEISGDEASDVRETNFVNSLSGKVSGVHIRQSNSMGGSADIIIRGYKSLTQNNQALFVVDGVPISNVNTSNSKVVANASSSTQNDGWGGYDYGNAAMDINPDDIESISILKGAAATALYGSRASNGVVLISTKKGKNKKGIGVTVNSGVMVSKIDQATMPKHQKKYGGGYGPFYEDPEWAHFFYADIDGDGVEDLITPTSEDASWGHEFDPNLMVIQWDALDPTADNYGEKRPWVAGANGIEYFFQTGLKYTNNVAFDGGNDKGAFRLSYTNVDEKGILPNSSIKRNTLNFNSSYNFTDKLTMNANISYINTKGKGRYGTGYDGGNVMQSFGQWFETNVDLKRLEEKWLRADGSQLSWNHGYYNDLHPIYFDNPYWVRNKNFEDDERNRYFGYAGMDYKFNDWLTLSGRLSIDSYDEVQNERIAVGSVDPSYYSNYTRNNKEINTDLMLKFNKSLGDDLSLSGFVGSNVRRNHTEIVMGNTVGGLIVPGLYSVKNSVSPINITESLIKKGINSAFGSMSFGYKNFFYVEVTDRYDVSSSLPKESNAYNYYSVSTSFIPSELLDVDFLSFLKVRANYALVGNDAPAYSTISTYSQGTSWGDNALFSVNSTLQNPDLKPEITKSIEVGIEGSLFNNRVNFDLAAYKDKSDDQILAVRVSRASGYVFRWVNGGEIENKGLELSLSGSPFKTSNFSWDIGLNWSANRNKVISLYEDSKNMLIYSAWDVSINATPGQPYGVIKGTNYVYTNGEPTVGENGYYMYERDEDGNKVVDAVIGNINPDWNMGFSNEFTFKGLSLRALLDIQKGGDIYSINTKYGQATGVYEETAGTNSLGNPIRDNVVSISEGDLGPHFNGGVALSDADPSSGGYILPGVKEDGSENDILVSSGRWGRAFYYNNSPTARYVFDATYVKLREIALAYSLPESMVSKTPLSSITVSLVGRNIAILFKNTKHFDPEAALSSGNQQGIETGSYPTSKVYGFNLKLGF